MTRRVGAAALMSFLLVVAGCGGGESAATSVTRYLEQVNAVQRDLALPLGSVGQANRELRSGAKLEKLRPKLERSARTIRTFERRLDALEPPKEARRLDVLIREVVHGEWQLAHEFALLSRYAPASASLLARATEAGREIRTALKATKRPRAQATALEAYAQTLTSVTRGLEQLEPPPVVVPEHRTQIQTYTRIAESARALAAALRRGKGATPELRRLEAAVVSGTTVRAQKARIAGIVAFNRRVVAVRKLAVKAQRERNRLERLVNS